MFIVAVATDIGTLSAFRFPGPGGNFFISRYCSRAGGGGGGILEMLLGYLVRLRGPRNPMRKAADEAVVSGG